jgi:hypothetical protein
MLDWHSKKVVGHYAGLQARAWHWLVALNRAVNRQSRMGSRAVAPRFHSVALLCWAALVGQRG